MIADQRFTKFSYMNINMESRPSKYMNVSRKLFSQKTGIRDPRIQDAVVGLLEFDEYDSQYEKRIEAVRPNNSCYT